jgi:hypothetical protein
MNRFGWVLIAGFVVAVQPCSAGVITQTKGPASIDIRWDPADAKLELADLITVTLTVEGAKPLATPTAPLELGDDAAWQLVQRSKASNEAAGPMRERWRLTYRFAPREPGKIAFAFPDVKYRDELGKEQTASWDPVWFEVKAPAAGALRDITAVEAPPALVSADYSAWIWSAVVAGAMFLITLGVGLRRFFRSVPAPTPAQVALAAWERLLAKRLAENGRAERFITLLTLLVRRYLERQFALPARRRTTPEFLQQLEACPLLTLEEKQFLEGFLDQCDAVKFAKSAMSADACRKLADAVRQFLERRAKPASVYAARGQV